MNLTPWLLGGALVLAAGSVAYGQIERASRVAAEADLKDAQDKLRDNEAALTALRRDRETTVAALEGVTRDLRASSANLQSARIAANAAPRSTACVASPGVRALRGSLLARDTAGAGGNRPAAR